MQTLKPEIRDCILHVAEKKFAKKGYLKTSMREIADASGIGVGNVYNYFSSKDKLLQAIVLPVTTVLERMLQEHHGSEGADIMQLRSEQYFKQIVNEYISLINKYKRLLTILLFKSEGSSLEKYREQYTDRATAMVKTWFAEMKKKHAEINFDVSDFTIHLQTVWTFTLLEELLMHNPGKQEMERIIKEYMLFEVHGWRAITNI